jgi:hypothetical protein
MKRVLIPTVAALLGAAPSLALAGDLAAGTYVQLSALHRRDAFFPDRKALVGLVCVVNEPGLAENREGFYGGPTTCSDGQEYYWYLAGFEMVTPDVAAMFGLTTGPAAEASAEIPWSVGSRVRIRAVSAADAYAEQSATLAGKTCSVKDAPLTPTGEDWWAGALACDGGSEYYFFQVAVDAADGAAPSAPAPTGGTTAAAGAPAGVGPGKLVRIESIDAADAFYGARDGLVGKRCTVMEAALVSSGGGSHAGRLFCEDGKNYQFFKVGVTPVQDAGVSP